MLYLLWLLLPVAALSGWLIAQKKETAEPNQNLLPADYFKGINYLLNEEPDKAVDIFIKMLEVNTDTVETHLALAHLFRRRGEVDRAIRIHQNLIARPNLTKAQRLEALSELGQDYLRAGVLDRAENLFQELINMGDTQCLVYLLDIYQQQREWQKAIDVAEKMYPGKNMQARVAHYHCEIAEYAKQSNDFDKMQTHLKLALKQNPNSIRANLLKAIDESNKSNYKNAIKIYDKLVKNHPEYITLILLPLYNCYKAQQQEAIFIEYLKNHLKENPSSTLVKALISHWDNLKNDINFQELKPLLTHSNSLDALKLLLNLLSTEHPLPTFIPQIQHLVDNLLTKTPTFRCTNCGFYAKTLHWQCPSCKEWDTLKEPK